MESKPKTKRNVINPVDAFVKAQKPLIVDLKNTLRKDINEIAENIKAKHTKPRKPMSEEAKKAASEKRKATMQAKKKAAPERKEFETQTEAPKRQTVDVGSQTSKPTPQFVAPTPPGVKFPPGPDLGRPIMKRK
jgi:thiamine pyrophosphate-dependent acetolactate synthase large subunit-like protein